MNIKPIIFSTPMVQKIQAGHKTQTRRVIRSGQRTPTSIGREKFYKMVDTLNNRPFYGAGFYKDSDIFTVNEEKHTDAEYFRSQFQPGDLLWVRETWQEFFEHELPNRPHGPNGSMGDGRNRGFYYYRADGDIEDSPKHGKAVWRPSIHMPRAAARVFLRVTAVRAERLQEISDEDCIAEGLTVGDLAPGDRPDAPEITAGKSTTQLMKEVRTFAGVKSKWQYAYLKLWSDLNGKRGGSAYAWSNNPWVWAYTFERTDKPEGWPG